MDPEMDPNPGPGCDGFKFETLRNSINTGPGSGPIQGLIWAPFWATFGPTFGTLLAQQAEARRNTFYGLEKQLQ